VHTVPAVYSRRVGSSILASLSEAGGDVLLPLASKPLPPRSLPLAKRHLECTLDPHIANDAPVPRIRASLLFSVSSEVSLLATTAFLSQKGSLQLEEHPASGINPMPAAF